MIKNYQLFSVLGRKDRQKKRIIGQTIY